MGGDQKKNECQGGLKKFLAQIFAWWAYCVPCQKRLTKIKYGFEGSISNVDFILFYPSNQLMFSFVKFGSVKSF